MQIVIILAIIILPVSAIVYGIWQGINEYAIPDSDGFLEINENGIYELRIL
jgi:hypothetical protein